MDAVTSVNGNSAGAELATKRRKLQGREFYESIGLPRTVVAPMVDQSELVRRLSPRALPHQLMHPTNTGLATPLATALTTEYTVLYADVPLASLC